MDELSKKVKKKKKPKPLIIYPFQKLTQQEFESLIVFLRTLPLESSDEFRHILSEQESASPEDEIWLQVTTSKETAQRIKSLLKNDTDPNLQELSLKIVTADFSTSLMEENKPELMLLAKKVEAEKKAVHDTLHNIENYTHYLLHPGTRHSCLGHDHSQPVESAPDATLDTVKDSPDSAAQKRRSEIDANAELADAIGGGFAFMTILSLLILSLNKLSGNRPSYFLDPDVTKINISLAGLAFGLPMLVLISLIDREVHNQQNQIARKAEILVSEFKQLKERLPALNCSDISSVLDELEIKIDDQQTIKLSDLRVVSFEEIDKSLDTLTKFKLKFYQVLYALGHLFENINQVMLENADEFSLLAKILAYPVFGVLALKTFRAEYSIAYSVLRHQIAFNEGHLINTAAPIPVWVSSDSTEVPAYTTDKTPQIFVCYNKTTKLLQYKTISNPTKWHSLSENHFEDKSAYEQMIQYASTMDDIEAAPSFKNEEADILMKAITKKNEPFISDSLSLALYQSPKILYSTAYILNTIFYFVKQNALSYTLASLITAPSAAVAYFVALRKENEAKQKSVTNSESPLTPQALLFIKIATWLMYRLALTSSRTVNCSYPANQWGLSAYPLAQCLTTLALCTIFVYTAYTSAKTADQLLTWSPEVKKLQNDLSKTAENFYSILQSRCNKNNLSIFNISRKETNNSNGETTDFYITPPVSESKEQPSSLKTPLLLDSKPSSCIIC